MHITPLEIQQKQFKVKWRGFDVREVDGFLEQVAGALEAALHKGEQLQDEIHRLEHESQGYKKREETFKHALLNSQKVIDQMKENAQKQASLLVAEAEVKAEKILNKAHKRLAQLHEDIAELKRQRMQIQVQISSILESHSKLLEIGKESMEAMEEEDSKVKLLK
jgi:cell division initiation protein